MFFVAAGLFFSRPSPAQFLTRDRPLAKDEIRIGMSNGESGRFGAVGSALKLGAEAYFTRINRQGGVNGRKLKLVAYDDRYEPLNSVVNTERLINQDRVFALFGYVGTATCEMIQPMLREANIPLIGPIASDSERGDPAQSLIFVSRPTVQQQIETIVSHLTKDLGITRIGLFRQDDAFGDAGRDALEKVLGRRGLELTGEGVYVRNSVDIQSALDQLVPAKPEAVLLVGTYQPCASLVTAMRARGLTGVIFACLSSAGTENLLKLLGSGAEGMIIPEVVPSPENRSESLVREYQDDLRSIGSKDFTYAGLEGYLNARVLASALEKPGPELTEQRFLEALRSTDLTYDSIRIRFDRAPTQGDALTPVLTQAATNQGLKGMSAPSPQTGNQPAPGTAMRNETQPAANDHPVFLIQIRGGLPRPVDALRRPALPGKL